MAEVTPIGRTKNCAQIITHGQDLDCSLRKRVTPQPEKNAWRGRGIIGPVLRRSGTPQSGVKAQSGGGGGGGGRPSTSPRRTVMCPAPRPSWFATATSQRSFSLSDAITRAPVAREGGQSRRKRAGNARRAGRAEAAVDVMEYSYWRDERRNFNSKCHHRSSSSLQLRVARARRENVLFSHTHAHALAGRILESIT